MGLFDRFKGKKTVDWSAAYPAEPKFYGRPDGTPVGAIELTEGTETVLPTAPQAAYRRSKDRSTIRRTRGSAGPR